MKQPRFLRHNRILVGAVFIYFMLNEIAQSRFRFVSCNGVNEVLGIAHMLREMRFYVDSCFNNKFILC